MNYSVNLSSGQTVEVVIGEAAQINIEQALNYIESGRVEITKYVNEWAKPEITNYTKEYAEPIVTEIVNQTTKPLIDYYLNTTTKPQIDEYVADNVKPYADSAQNSAAKAKISEDNAKTSETNAKASELAAASSAGVASAAAVTATEAKDYTAKVLTDENLKTVGQDLQSADSNIKTVATNILNVNTVAKNIDNVNLLAPHTEAMEALAPDIMDVVTVAGITEQTKNVSDNMAHVVAVDNNKANIDKAVTNEANITTVATDMNNIKTVANNIDIIDNVAWNKLNINNVSVNMPFVEGVSENVEHVVAVDRNKANIDNVATNKTNINNVASNITAVNNVSENMADVKNAVQSANDAKLWAVGTITEKPEGSSKYWAEEAKNAVQTPDATETVKGIVRLATSEEVTAGTNNSAAITPLKLKQKIAQNLTNPSADTVPSTKAVSDESSRIVSIMDNKVNKSGDTMTGDFIIEKNSEGILVIRSLTRDSAVNPEIWGAFGLLEFRDKNNVLTGLIENWQYEDGRMHILMRVINRGNSAQILLGAKTDGSFYTECPASNNNNSIVTTVSYGSNYVRFGNGLQICFGNVITNNNTQTVTYAQPFKEENPNLTLSLIDGGPADSRYWQAFRISEEKNTGFKIQGPSEISRFGWIAIGYWY